MPASVVSVAVEMRELLRQWRAENRASYTVERLLAVLDTLVRQQGFTVFCAGRLNVTARQSAAADS